MLSRFTESLKMANLVLCLVSLLTLTSVITASPAPSLGPSRLAPTPYPDHSDDQTLLPPIVAPTTEATYLWGKESFPNPQTQMVECRQNRSSLLCDPDMLLKPNEASSLHSQLDDLSANPKCLCPECPEGENGLKVGIALVKAIFRRYNHPEEAQEFANFLRRQWRFGLCNNSMLILYISDSQEISISSGSTAMEFIPESMLAETVKTSFVDASPASGLAKVLDQMKAALNLPHARSAVKPDEHNEVSPTTTTALMVVGTVVAFMIIVSMIVAAIVLMKKRYQSSEQSGGGQADAEDDETEAQTPQGYWNDPEVRKQESVRRSTTGKNDYEPVSIEEEGHTADANRTGHAEN